MTTQKFKTGWEKKKKTLSNLITLGTVDAHCNRLTKEEKSKTKKERKEKDALD